MIHPIECRCAWCAEGRSIVARASDRALLALLSFGAAVAVCR